MVLHRCKMNIGIRACIRATSNIDNSAHINIYFNKVFKLVTESRVHFCHKIIEILIQLRL